MNVGTRAVIAMELQEDLFERLSEDLTSNIFQRLLWSPSSFEPNKAHQRVQLEAVSKNFKALVWKTGCLEWEINSPREEQIFLRYMTKTQSGSFLTNVALYLERPVDLKAILQSFIPLALDSLKEIHLVFLGWDEEDKIVDCELVFHLLQDCQQLVALHILLWDYGREGPDPLELKAYPKPFPALRILALPKHAVSDDTLSTMLPCFPVLEILELHSVHTRGEHFELRSSSLKEYFWWSSEAPRLTIKGPERAGMPRSLGMVMGLLNSGNEHMEWTALNILADLSASMEDPQGRTEQAIVQFPGCLQKVATFLHSQDVGYRNEALWILMNLAPFEEMVIATSPGCLHGLAQLLASRESDSVCLVASIVSSLADDSEFCTLLVDAPGILQGLVKLLDHEDPDVRVAVDGALEKLGNPMEGAKALAFMPQSLEKLVRILDNGSAELQVKAAHSLCRLAYALADENVEGMLKVPGCLENVVGLLGSECLYTQERSVWTLARLAEFSTCRHTLLAMPGLLESLLEFLKLDEGTFSEAFWEATVRVLANMDLNSKQMRAIASLPDVMLSLLQSEGGENISGLEAATSLLGQMMSDSGLRGVVEEARRHQESCDPCKRGSGCQWSHSCHLLLE